MTELTDEQKVKAKYPDAFLIGDDETLYEINVWRADSGFYNILSKLCATPAEAWADAAKRIEVSE
jgi:hypothetical protein